jgi:hypothetical protein
VREFCRSTRHLFAHYSKLNNSYLLGLLNYDGTKLSIIVTNYEGSHKLREYKVVITTRFKALTV